MDKRQLKAFEKKLTARCQELQTTVQRNLRDGRASDMRAVEIGDIAATSFEKEIVFGQNTSAFQHLRLSLWLSTCTIRAAICRRRHSATHGGAGRTGTLAHAAKVLAKLATKGSISTAPTPPCTRRE